MRSLTLKVGEKSLKFESFKCDSPFLFNMENDTIRISQPYSNVMLIDTISKLKQENIFQVSFKDLVKFAREIEKRLVVEKI